MMGYRDRALETPNQRSQRVSPLHAWLSPADAPRNADLIFVLAGRLHRKEYALHLLRQSVAPRALFSVGRFEIRRFSKMALPVPLDLLKLAQELPPPLRHYFVFFHGPLVQVEHVPPRRFGTLTEIEALARWLEKKPEISSVLVVSSDAHLRRIRLCCRALLSPKLELAFLAAPVPLSDGDAPAKPDLLELFKLTIYWILLKFRSRDSHDRIRR
jgi:uncharacterized SAM-binding protein YcdF (DUF218 family)